MKLLTRTTLIYVCITLVVFAFGSLLFYSFLSSLVIEEATEALEARKQLVIRALDTDSVVYNTALNNDIVIKETAGEFSDRLTDTTIFQELEKEEAPYRLLTFHHLIHGRHYAVSIRSAVLESDDLIEGVFTSFLIVLVLLAITVIVGIQLTSRSIWKPFFSTLNAMKEFRPGNKTKMELPDSGITEFRQLNDAITKMTANTETAFQSLKSFSENAAHEIQTPLAILQSTTEVLLQDSTLTEDQYKTLSHLSSTTARLSNIVSALLLLTRIENKQFLQDEPINFTTMLHSKLDLFSELFAHRNISLTINVQENVQVKLHPVLAEIVISNLLVNAIRHTNENGSAVVELTNSSFCVRNSGAPLKGQSHRIFERFYKEDQSEQSTGLGLSLVKMVADASGLEIAYEYISSMHVFTLKW